MIFVLGLLLCLFMFFLSVSAFLSIPGGGLVLALFCVCAWLNSLYRGHLRRQAVIAATRRRQVTSAWSMHTKGLEASGERDPGRRRGTSQATIKSKFFNYSRSVK